MIEITTAMHSGMEFDEIATRLENAMYQQYINRPEYLKKNNSRHSVYMSDVKKNYVEMELKHTYDVENKQRAMEKEFTLSFEKM